MLQIGKISEGFKLKTYFRNGTLMLQIDQISEGFKMLIEKPTAVSFMQTIQRVFEVPGVKIYI